MKQIFSRMILGLALAGLVPACTKHHSNPEGPPTISNLSITPLGAYLNSGGGTAQVNGTFDFYDQGGDVTSVTLTVLDNAGTVLQTQTDPVPGAAGITNGVLSGSVQVSTTTLGTYQVQVYLTNQAGLASNVLSTSFRISVQPWVSGTAMPTPRGGCAVAALNGLIYVMGGVVNSTGLPTAVVEIYDPSSDTWTTGVPLPAAYTGLIAASVNGTILLFGAPATLVFDPTVGSWSSKSANPGLPLAGIAALNNQVYVFGGNIGASGTDVLQVYDVSLDSWSAGFPLPYACESPGGAALGTNVYAIGGYEPAPPTDAQYIAATSVLDTGTGMWTVIAQLTVPRAAFGCSVASGLIFAIGGQNWATVSTVEAFDPAQGTWQLKTDLPSPLAPVGAVTVNDIIYVFGPTTTLQYTPANDVD